MISNHNQRLLLALAITGHLHVCPNRDKTIDVALPFKIFIQVFEKSFKDICW